MIVTQTRELVPETRPDGSISPEPPVRRAGPKRRVPRWLAVVVGVVLVAAGLSAYQLGVRQHRPPHFARGGAFLGAGAGGTNTKQSATATANAGGRATPAQDNTVTHPGAGAPRQPAAVTSGTETASAGSATAPAAAATDDQANGGTAANGTSAATAAGAATATALPALGTYTYDITGQESITGFGTRSFPPTMTATVHGASGLQPYEVDVDLHFSDQHNERDILGYRSNGVNLDYEAGSISFGPMTQTSEDDYDPPITLIPQPSAVGTTRTGSSTAELNGKVDRVEDWTTKVTGTQVLDIEGRPVQCIVVQVHRQTTPGSGDQETRSTTFWYAPALRLWVKWTQTMHAQRNYGVTFTYDESFTATLAGYRQST